MTLVMRKGFLEETELCKISEFHIISEEITPVGRDAHSQGESGRDRGKGWQRCLEGSVLYWSIGA